MYFPLCFKDKNISNRLSYGCLHVSIHQLVSGTKIAFHHVSWHLKQLYFEEGSVACPPSDMGQKDQDSAQKPWVDAFPYKPTAKLLWTSFRHCQAGCALGNGAQGLSPVKHQHPGSPPAVPQMPRSPLGIWSKRLCGQHRAPPRAMPFCCLMKAGLGITQSMSSHLMAHLIPELLLMPSDTAHVGWERRCKSSSAVCLLNRFLKWGITNVQIYWFFYHYAEMHESWYYMKTGIFRLHMLEGDSC